MDAVGAGSLPDELKQHLKQLAFSQVQIYRLMSVYMLLHAYNLPCDYHIPGLTHFLCSH